MLCSMRGSAQRRYVVSSVISAGLVILLAVAAALAFRLGHVHGPVAYMVAVLPALPIVWMLIETGVYLAAEKDEFQRNVLIQCLLGGTGGTLAATTMWGYLEDFVHAPRFHLTCVYAVFVFFAAISYPVVSRRYR